MTGSTSRPGPGSPRPAGLRWSGWNLLLLLPLLMLVVPWFNADQPRVLGMPVFYWSQFLWVVVGVVSVYLVYRMTKDRGDAPPVPEPEPAVDTLDEATAASAVTPSPAEPVVDEPVTEEAVVKEPAVEEPAVEEPAVDETAADKPATDKPATDEEVTR
jgi:Protein of unknown function (DUF3311)